VESSGVSIALGVAPVPVAAAPAGNRFFQNGKKRLLRSFLLGRRLVPHSEAILVSPYLSLGLFTRSHRFGRVLDDLLEDGTSVTLITRWPTLPELDTYRDLEVRGLGILFHKTVHAKLYVFKVRRDGARHAEDFRDAVVIGSANLTEMGFGFDEQNFNEELCYELPEGAYDGALDFVYQLAGQAVDLMRVRRELTRR